MANPQKEYFDEEGNPIGRETVGERFANVDSLEARAHEGRDSKKKQILGHAFQKAVALAGYEDEFENIASLWDELVAFKQRGAQDAAKQVIKNILQKLLLSRLAPWLFGISLAVYALQLTFALVSLAGIGIWASLAYALNETLLGRTVNFVVGFFGNIQTLFPVEYLAMGFWALATLVGMIGFVGFILFFHLIGVNMMRSTISTLIFFTCMAFTILPVGNLIPGLFLWVLYVVSSETSVFNMFLDHHSTAHAFNAPLRQVGNMANENTAQRKKLQNTQDDERPHSIPFTQIPPTQSIVSSDGAPHEPPTSSIRELVKGQQGHTSLPSHDSTNEQRTHLSEQNKPPVPLAVDSKYTEPHLDVATLTKEKGTFFVHTIQVSNALDVSENNKSIDTKKLTTSDRLDILYGANPTLSASTLRPNTQDGTFFGGFGVLFSQGEVVSAHVIDAGTKATSLTERHIIGGVRNSKEDVDRAIDRKHGGHGKSYNEIVLERPEVAGGFMKISDERYKKRISTEEEIVDYGQGGGEVTKKIGVLNLSNQKNGVIFDTPFSVLLEMKKRGPVFLMDEHNQMFRVSSINESERKVEFSTTPFRPEDMDEVHGKQRMSDEQKATATDRLTGKGFNIPQTPQGKELQSTGDLLKERKSETNEDREVLPSLGVLDRGLLTGLSPKERNFTNSALHGLKEIIESEGLSPEAKKFLKETELGFVVAGIKPMSYLQPRLSEKKRFGSWEKKDGLSEEDIVSIREALRRLGIHMHRNLHEDVYNFGKKEKNALLYVERDDKVIERMRESGLFTEAETQSFSDDPASFHSNILGPDNGGYSNAARQGVLLGYPLRDVKDFIESKTLESRSARTPSEEKRLNELRSAVSVRSATGLLGNASGWRSTDPHNPETQILLKKMDEAAILQKEIFGTAS